MSEQVYLSKSKEVAAVLEAEIVAGRLPRGAQLESEHTLARRFSVSRNTVRKGLEDLARRGFIATQGGVGSFVMFDGRTIDNRLGWSRALARAGVPTTTEILRLAVTRDAKLADELGMSDDRFIIVDRLRRLDSGLAISLERSRIPPVPELLDLPSRGLVGDSLSLTLKEAGLRTHHGEEWAELTTLGTADARVLGRRRGTPFLRTRRLSRTADDRLVEYVVSLLDPHRFQLHLEFGDR